MAGALDGLLVVSREQAVAAPFCTQRLLDAGARVIKIERDGGETARPPARTADFTSGAVPGPGTATERLRAEFSG